MKRAPAIIAAASLLVLTAAAYPSASPELFPKVDGWTLRVEPKQYTPENLWDFIDGAADVYLSYGFVDLNIGEYRNAAGTDIRVELYRHSSRENAFGMYAQERNTDYHFIPIGTQGYIEDGVLNVLCGMFYVKITTQVSGTAAIAAMKEIGAKVAAHLQQDQSWPRVLGLFPPEHRRINAETYVADNYLGYKVLRDAFIATYDAPDPYTCFIIDAGTPDAAGAMFKAYVSAIGTAPSPGTTGTVRVADPHNGTVFLAQIHGYLFGVTSCSEDATAEKAMGALLNSIAAH